MSWRYSSTSWRSVRRIAVRPNRSNGRAAQPAAGPQHPERRSGGRAEADLALHAEGAQHRRVEHDLGPAGTELAGQPGPLGVEPVEPGDLVLVLVGHQLVQAGGEGPGDDGVGAGAAILLGRGDVGHLLQVAGGVGGVLVVDEVGDPGGDHRLQRLRQPGAGHVTLGRGEGVGGDAVGQAGGGTGGASGR